MLTPLCNRNPDGHFAVPADGWFHLVPRGVFPCPAIVRGQRPELSQILDDRVLDSIGNQFRAENARPGFPGLLVDFDHFSYDPAQPSEAAGWLVEMERRPDGLWGRIKWTDKGGEAVSHGRYRFVSPTWLLRDCESVPSGTGSPAAARDAKAAIRPLRLDSLALTNSPNLRGMAPLSNRREAASAPSLVQAERPTQSQENHRMKSVANSLGLSPDAAEEAVLAEVSKLQHRVKLAEEAVAPVKNRVVELEAAHAALLSAQVESDLEIHQNRFPAAQRDQWKTALLANRVLAVGLLSGLPETDQPAVGNRSSAIQSGRPPIHNRETAGDPGRRLAGEAAAEAGSDTPENRVQAAAIRNRATELRAASKKLTYDQAFNAARAELGGKAA